MAEEKIKVLIVEDSPIKRELISHILTSDKSIEVIGSVSSGAKALLFLQKKKPDVITMDIHMAGMNGFETAEKIMSTTPMPIVIISSIRNKKNSSKLSKAMLQAGALYFLDSPHGPWHEDFEQESKNIVRIVKLMSKVKTVTRRKKSNTISSSNENKIKKPESIVKIVAIGASTGGPAVLDFILKNLPENFNLPVVIAQHLGKGFDNLLQTQLNNNSRYCVKIAENNMLLEPGCAYIAPGGCHLKVSGKSTLIIEDGDTGIFLNVPSIDVLFNSVKDVYCGKALAILLTGMGNDGAEGLKKLKEAGAVTVAQNKESCTVYGMPCEAVKLNAETYVLSPTGIIKLLDKLNNN